MQPPRPRALRRVFEVNAPAGSRLPTGAPHVCVVRYRTRLSMHKRSVGPAPVGRAFNTTEKAVSIVTMLRQGERWLDLCIGSGRAAQSFGVIGGAVMRLRTLPCRARSERSKIRTRRRMLRVAHAWPPIITEVRTTTRSCCSSTCSCLFRSISVHACRRGAAGRAPNPRWPGP